MRLWDSLGSLLSRQRHKDRYAAELRLATAYQRVFLGNPTNDDQNLVLVDLANATGFYRVTPPGPTQTRDDIVFNEGMRAAFGRIFRFLNMTDQERDSLAAASRASSIELAANQQE